MRAQWESCLGCLRTKEGGCSDSLYLLYNIFDLLQEGLVANVPHVQAVHNHPVEMRSLFMFTFHMHTSDDVGVIQQTILP